MKKMWKKTIGIFCTVGLSVMCLTGCGKDTAGSPEISTQEIQQNNVADGAQANNNTADDEAQANNNTTDDGASGSRGDGEFLEGANLQGTVVEFSETGFTLSPASTEADGKVLAEAASGSENDENNVQITYTDNPVFQIVNYSMDSWSELSREDTDKESIKKGTSVAVFGSCQDTYHWTADKILIIRYQ